MDMLHFSCAWYNPSSSNQLEVESTFNILEWAVIAGTLTELGVV
ncbi:hypothetical protein ACT7DH_26685 [Bacillus pacificus]